ncbi:bifunctional metallophosphatase/5'-nucleotidase [Desulfoplanes formicivorans]|uniref:bifunctional metallophosphatase/5'-nucleotidase n=1 Tax=Desulfoplanes formicivorans TaxID=1592317 RepID=UPI0015B54CB9|nr:5'-nucleotidase C-terminal domain-containing protein [Desulfoplanes formicivorans]
MPGSRFPLTIMHLNDTHSHLTSLEDQSILLDGVKTSVDMGGLARIRTRVEQIRSQHAHTLLLHAGDAVQGTLFFTRYQGDADVAALNLLGVDAMAVGNHEFDKGPQLLARWADKADFPLLGANVDVSGEPRLQGKIRPYVIKTLGGHQVGIIGLTTPETAFVSSPGETVQFDDVAATARNMITELKGQGVNKIIALTHLGYEQDMALARGVDGIDLIVGGHSHSLLGENRDLGMTVDGPYPTRVTSPDGSPVYIVQAWAKARELGTLGVKFNGEGVIEAWEADPVIVLGDRFKRKDGSGKKIMMTGKAHKMILDAINDTAGMAVVEPDQTMAALIAPYAEGVKEMATEVVARVAEDLDHVRVPGFDRYGKRDDCPNGSLVAPLVADSLLWKANAHGLRADLALQNAGGVRTSLHEGGLTVGHVYTLLPFGNTLVVLELSGREVHLAIEQGVDAALHGNAGAFPYPSHARFLLHPGASKGSRVTDMEIRDADGVWQPLDADRIYRVAVNSYMARGGDRYHVLEQSVKKRYDTGFVDAQTFLEYAAHRNILHRPEQTGIRVVSE